MKQPTTRVQALIEVAEALVAVDLERVGGSGPVDDIADALEKLQRKAKRALKMPSGNPNMAEAAKKGRAVRAVAADEKAEGVKPLIVKLRGEGFLSYRELAQEMNRRKVPAPQGGYWHPASVRAAELRKP